MRALTNAERLSWLRPLLRPEWRGYLGYFKGRFRLFLASIAAALAKGAALAYLALALRSFLEAIVSQHRGAALLDAFEAVFMALAASGLAFIAAEATVRLTKPVIAQLRLDLSRRVLAMEPSVHHELGQGAVHAVVVRDTEHIDVMTHTLVALVIPSAVAIVALIGLMLRISPLFGAGSIAVAAVVFLLSRGFRRAIAPSLRRFDAAGVDFSRSTLLMQQRFDLARAFAATEREVVLQDRQVRHLERESRRSAWRMAAVGELHAALNNVALIAFVMAGALAVHYSGGAYDLVVVFLVLMLMRAQAAIIVAGLPYLDAGSLALERVWRLLQTPAAAPYGGSVVLEFQGRIDVENLSFRYGQKPLLNAVSLSVAPGEVVAICGHNGVGKTTLINLILALLRPTAGQVLADSVSYDHLDLGSLRRQMALVPQSPGLFTGTVAENIAYALPDASPGAIAEAAERAGAAEFINAMPHGYDSLIGEDGALLSGGQRQRIALARALLCKPRLLILDEPTNHLDVESTARLMKTLRSLPDHPTVLLVSHNDDVLDAVDRVLVLARRRLSPAELHAGRWRPATSS